MKLLRIAWDGLLYLASNKLRAFFMMAGTMVGITALTVIMAIGKGTEAKIAQRIQNFGPDAIMLISGGGRDMPPPDLSVTSMKLQDAEALRRDMVGVKLVTSQAMKRQVPMKYQGAETMAMVWAVEALWHDAWNWHPEEGEGLTDDDVASLARVCLLGNTVRQSLFGNAPAVGEFIQMGNVRFQVKGVLQTRGASPMGDDFDNRVIVPITTGMRRLMNQDHINMIRLLVHDPAQMPTVVDQIRSIMRQRHHITPPQEDDFRVVSPLAIAALARGSSRTLSVLLMILAGLSLLVGGVILMNILLISVDERKREIGLRRALGARRRDVLAQFLAESLVVTLLGMVLGSLLGLAITLVLARFTPLPARMSWESLGIAVGFALLVGLFFGVQPARKAAALKPVDALR
jgi:putative ABC transport system permease protein